MRLGMGEITPFLSRLVYASFITLNSTVPNSNASRIMTDLQTFVIMPSQQYTMNVYHYAMSPHQHTFITNTGPMK